MRFALNSASRSLQNVTFAALISLVTACGNPGDDGKDTSSSAPSTTGSTIGTTAPSTVDSSTSSAPSSTTAATTTTTAAPSTTTAASPTTTPSTTVPTTASSSDSSTSETAGGDVATLTEVRDILILSCGYGICHLPNYIPPDFGKDGDDLYTLLTTWMVEECDNAAIIVPGDASASGMVRLIEHQCGALYMPPDTYQGFTDEDFERIKAWINAGAPH